MSPTGFRSDIPTATLESTKNPRPPILMANHWSQTRKSKVVIRSGKDIRLHGRALESTTIPDHHIALLQLSKVWETRLPLPFPSPLVLTSPYRLLHELIQIRRHIPSVGNHPLLTGRVHAITVQGNRPSPIANLHPRKDLGCSGSSSGLKPRWMCSSTVPLPPPSFS